MDLAVDSNELSALRPGISAVVPVYNSEQTLRPLVERLSEVLGQQFGADGFEIVLVNDGSRDGSWERVSELAAEYPCVRGIGLMRNFGQHNALLCGIRTARHELIVTLDDDLQNPPDEIPRLVAELQEGVDVVYGAPQQEQHGFLRDLASQITKFVLQKAMGAETARNISAFRVFRTHLRRAFADYRGPLVSIDVLLTWGTTRFSVLRVRHEPRTVGRSNYTLGMLVNHAFNMLTGFSAIPLRIASLLGFALTAFGLLVLGFVVVRFLVEGSSAPGFPFLASIISIFAGAQLFAIGIIGEYLGRLHFRVMDRPTYVVRYGSGEDE